MKKHELIDDVARRTGHSKADVRTIRRRPEKVARNLHNGERVVVPARNVAVYRSSEAVDDAVNGRRVAEALTTGD